MILSFRLERALGPLKAKNALLGIEMRAITAADQRRLHRIAPPYRVGAFCRLSTPCLEKPVIAGRLTFIAFHPDSRSWYTLRMPNSTLHARARLVIKHSAQAH